MMPQFLQVGSLMLITFLSAFLMFQLELMIAKLFLPYYGGSYMVWGSCLVFFQAVLLAGYLFAHNAIKAAGFYRFRWIYLVLLLVPLLFFPGHAVEMSHAHTGLPLAADVFLKLLLSIGPVFFVLSTVSIVLQVWFASSTLKNKTSPYFLYAVSNAGSLLGLLSYPFVFEYLFDLGSQQMIWRILYGILVIINLLALMSVRVLSAAAPAAAGSAEKKPVKQEQKVEWFLLGAAGVVIFLSVNNLITSKIAPVPLLWIFPLGIYLLSFILNFQKNSWCPEFIRKRIIYVMGFSSVVFLLIVNSLLPTTIDIILLLAAQFMLCMYCQNTLIRGKPEHEDDLSLFYVLISSGGFVGGMIVTWILPFVVTFRCEFFIGLFLIAMSQGLPSKKDFFKWENVWSLVLFSIFLIFWLMAFPKYNVWGLLILFYLVYTTLRRLEPVKGAAILASFYLVIYYPLIAIGMDPFHNVIFQERNFYGIYEIRQALQQRLLFNGQILHGMQLLSPGDEFKSTSYYTGESPIGELMASEDFHFHSIGAIGLGIGSVANLTGEGQTVDFYEIDPLVNRIANEYFTYIPKARSDVQVYFGDARITMESMPEKRYDLIVVDAFSGDGIPVHLINKESALLYKERMNPGGIALFHISNSYVELQPVIEKFASQLGGRALYKSLIKKDDITTNSSWAVLTWDPDVADKLAAKGWTGFPEKKRVKGYFPGWTDEYSSILPVFKYKNLISEIKFFKPFYW